MDKDIKGRKGINGSGYTRIRIYGISIIRELITIIKVTYSKQDHLI